MLAKIASHRPKMLCDDVEDMVDSKVELSFLNQCLP